MLRLFCWLCHVCMSKVFCQLSRSFPATFPANFEPGPFVLPAVCTFSPLPGGVMYLLWDPAVFPRGAALLVEESIEIYCLYAAAAPVLIPKQNKMSQVRNTVCNSCIVQDIFVFYQIIGRVMLIQYI